jgi:hypothetical protein
MRTGSAAKDNKRIAPRTRHCTDIALKLIAYQLVHTRSGEKSRST